MTKTAFLAILALQICLDRRGFSPNAMDGQTGVKTRTALAAYCAANGLPPPRGSKRGFDVSTAQDLAKLGCRLATMPETFKYTSRASYTVTA